MNSHRLFLRAPTCLLVLALSATPWNVALAAPAQETDAPQDAAEPDAGADAAESGEQDPPGDATEEGATEEGATEEGATEEAATEEAATEEADDDAINDAEEVAAAEDELAEEEGPERPDEPRWGREQQRAMKGKGMLVAGLMTTVLGGAFVGAAFAITKCDYTGGLECRYGDQRNFLVPTAFTMTGTGLLLTFVGLGMRRRYKKWERWTPEAAMVAPTLLQGGGGMAFSGRF